MIEMPIALLLKLKISYLLQTKINDSYYGKIEDLYNQYQSYLKRNDDLDFDDIIMLTVRLFESNQRILEFYQRKFEYIHNDEHQDCNKAQYVLMRMLSNNFKRICVVGDSDQGCGCQSHFVF